MKEKVKETSREIETICFFEKVELPPRWQGPRSTEAGYLEWYPETKQFCVKIGAGGGYYTPFFYTLEEIEKHMGRIPKHKFYTLTFVETVYREEKENK